MDAFADSAALFDRWVIDGIIARMTSLVVSLFGTLLRALQTGVVHVYAAMMVVGVVAMGWFFVWHPQARASVVEQAEGRYMLEAAPGLGYGFRWHTKSPEQPDHAAFGAARTVSVNLAPGETRKVVLEVRNAFDRTSMNTFLLARPASGGDSHMRDPGTTVLALPPGAEVRP